MDLNKKCIQFLENSQYSELNDYLHEHINESDSRLWNYWGIAQSSLGNPEQANIYFKKAIDLNPHTLHYFINYFTSCFPLKKGKEALDFLERLAPGMEPSEICNTIVPNIYEALIACDISLLDIPKGLYSYMIFNKHPVEYILENYESVRAQWLEEFIGIQNDKDLIYITLKMDIEKRIDIIKLVMAMGMVYGNNDLSSMGLDKISPDNAEFENLIVSASKTLTNLLRTYTLKNETTESMLHRVLPHDHFFGLFQTFVIITVSQKYDLDLSQIYETESKIDKLNQEFLIDLLDFETCESEEEVLEKAELIASELINNWKIKTKRGEHRFLALEFYLCIPNLIEDSAVHCRDEQLNSGTFYFHTKSKFPNWSPPIFNRHGVDITCGNREKGIYGGILLRHISGEKTQDGSGRALRGIVRGDKGFETVKRGSSEAKWSEEEKDFFKRINNQSIFGNEIQLIYEPITPKLKLRSIKRIGIENTSHANLNLRFICELTDEYKKVA